jgi:hypothetical protein
MNNRIQELAEQCSFTKDKYGLYWDDTANADGVDLEKFAELIVAECAKVAKKVDGDEGDDYKSGRTWAGIDVLKHFGVEE